MRAYVCSFDFAEKNWMKFNVSRILHQISINPFINFIKQVLASEVGLVCPMWRQKPYFYSIKSLFGCRVAVCISGKCFVSPTGQTQPTPNDWLSYWM